METGGVELIGVRQLEKRGLQERWIRAIFGPSIGPCIDVGVMEFMALGFEVIPLHPGLQDLQNGVKEFVEREFGRWPCFGSFPMGLNVSVKVFTRDLGRNPMGDERRHRSVELGIPRHLLPDEGGEMKS